VSRFIGSLSLYQCLELVALLAAISGILLLLSATIVRVAVLRSAQRPALMDDGRALLLAIRRLGVVHLAVGGALFTLAEAVELIA
jgi:hypothetical protein